jgi:hypothetical protein
MSIEKELLKRMRDVLRGLEETHYDLYWDIQSELEKIEQKPNNVGYLYKQQDCYGEIETVFSFDKPYIRWHNVTDVTPVYLAPQKHEPAQTAREMYQRGYAKAKYDLKREPLSDDWIKDTIHLIHQDVSFTDLVRIIEKAHGIGE